MIPEALDTVDTILGALEFCQKLNWTSLSKELVISSCH